MLNEQMCQISKDEKRYECRDYVYIDDVKTSATKNDKGGFDFGLSGYWYTANYGAALTGYALYTYISALGYSVLMIDLPGFQFAENHMYRDDYSPTRRFIQMNCSVSKKYQTEVELLEINELCNDFILGSDQMWNWGKNHYRDEGAFYLLDYVSNEKRKIAYGTSFGVDKFEGSSEDKGIFGYLLNRFTEVSVREKEGAEIAKELFGVDAVVVVDPVFLLSKDDYIQHIRFCTIDKNKIPDKFIFLYLLQPTKEKLEYARKAARILNLNVIAVSDLDPSYVEYVGCVPWDMDYLQKIEVADWLHLMNEAEYVITDSYHGFCFSLILHKQFTALKPRGGLNRFYTVAEIAEISERICVNLDEDNCIKILNKTTDYRTIDRYLEKKINESKEWLRNVLKKSQRVQNRGDVYDVVRYMMLRKQEEDKKYQDKLKADIDLKLHNMKSQIIVNRYFIIKLFLEKMLIGKRVAIRCAGIHTRELLKVISDKSVVKCIWDKNVFDEMFCGYPCVWDIGDLERYEIDTILISSYQYRYEIKRELSGLSDKYAIIDLYEALEEEGIVFESEFYWF